MDTALATVAGPTGYKEAIADPRAIKWKEAMEKELNELKRHNTWTLVPLPPGRKAIPGRWVLALKETDSEPIYKARWVAKGCWQQLGLDFNETYANTVNPIASRLLLAYAALHNWEIHQWDVKSAFPNAPVQEEIYIRQPTGYEQGDKNTLVCKLNKALYGLKQAAREWEQCLKGLLTAIGLTSLPIDQSVYIAQGETPIILMVHVDDIIAMSPKIEEINRVYKLLDQQVQLKNMGEAKIYLGLEIKRDRQKGSISLHQSKYTKKILDKYRPGIKPISNPEKAIPVSLG